jgi:hypothetical protein
MCPFFPCNRSTGEIRMSRLMLVAAACQPCYFRRVAGLRLCESRRRQDGENIKNLTAE